ncbi:hypothetical protein HQ563_05975 [bacterium]|nr:hypothetical protein [bacterium]
MGGASPSARARLSVESKSVFGLSPTSVSSEARGKHDVAVAKVIAHAQSAVFREEAAKAGGVSPEAVGRVVFQGIINTKFLDVRAELADRELAAKVANAVARKLAEDFERNPDVDVRVLDYARGAPPVREVGER